jgi:hypothetical protein
MARGLRLAGMRKRTEEDDEAVRERCSALRPHLHCTACMELKEPNISPIHLRCVLLGVFECLQVTQRVCIMISVVRSIQHAPTLLFFPGSK